VGHAKNPAPAPTYLFALFEHTEERHSRNLSFTVMGDLRAIDVRATIISHEPVATMEELLALDAELQKKEQRYAPKKLHTGSTVF
jgi:hypothetical protein